MLLILQLDIKTHCDLRWIESMLLFPSCSFHAVFTTIYIISYIIHTVHCRKSKICSTVHTQYSCRVCVCMWNLLQYLFEKIHPKNYTFKTFLNKTKGLYTPSLYFSWNCHTHKYDLTFTHRLLNFRLSLNFSEHGLIFCVFFASVKSLWRVVWPLTVTVHVSQHNALYHKQSKDYRDVDRLICNSKTKDVWKIRF